MKTNFVISVLTGLGILILQGLSLQAGEFTLSKNCPIHFQKKEAGDCLLQSLYQNYPNGLGGLRRNFSIPTKAASPELIDLGRLLFFDPLLSGNHQLSCAHCHQPQKGLSDGLAQSRGKDGMLLTRSSPSLWNVGLMKSYFWDGRAKTLEEQAHGPLFSKVEMNNTPEQLEREINESLIYRDLFQTAFPKLSKEPLKEPFSKKFSKERSSKITIAMIVQALVAFETTLVSINSPYDWYVHGVHSALNAQEIRGLNVFRSFVARCHECHTPPLFTNHELAAIGAPEPKGKEFDLGAENYTHQKAYRGSFKVPSIRNIATTAPYMHSGVFSTLKEVAEFYNEGGGRSLPEMQAMKDLNIHWHIVKADLTRQEIKDLVVFMKDALTDESALPKTPQKVPSGLPVLQ